MTSSQRNVTVINVPLSTVINVTIINVPLSTVIYVPLFTVINVTVINVPLSLKVTFLCLCPTDPMHLVIEMHKDLYKRWVSCSELQSLLETHSGNTKVQRMHIKSIL